MHSHICNADMVHLHKSVPGSNYDCQQNNGYCTSSIRSFIEGQEQPKNIYAKYGR